MLALLAVTANLSFRPKIRLAAFGVFIIYGIWLIFSRLCFGIFHTSRLAISHPMLIGIVLNAHSYTKMINSPAILCWRRSPFEPLMRRDPSVGN